VLNSHNGPQTDFRADKMLRSARVAAMTGRTAASGSSGERQQWAYSVEKLHHAKIASETWNAVPAIG